jgi:hypothetical protein
MGSRKDIDQFADLAMGTGTDVAIEIAGITLLRGDLTGIVRARRLSQAVMRNIRSESVLRLRLQRRRRADRGRRALPGLRHRALARDRRSRDGAVIGERGCKCAAVAEGEAVVRRC